MGRLDGRVAVVTGGANGIGRACCDRFAEEGADIVVGDVDDDQGAATVKAVEALGRRALYRRTDATSEADNEALMQAAADELGGVDVVVTAAGISHAGYRSGDVESERRFMAERAPLLQDLPRQLLETRSDEWEAVLDVNLTGTFLAVRAAARRMVPRGRGGSIITIASIAAKHPEAGPPAYAVSKAGVWMLTKQAARLLGPAGIRVNAIGPGFIQTNMTALLWELPDIGERILERLPLGRVGTPREVANTALFLASDESSYFTGEILHPDGGFVTD